MNCLVIGGSGFVGARIVAAAAQAHWHVTSVNRANYAAHKGQTFDLVINANGNARKFIAEKDPSADFVASVVSVQNSLRDFEFQRYVLISSIDVYSRPDDAAYTLETAEIDPAKVTVYGRHKRLAELAVMECNRPWQIVRLGQMIGPDLRKGPVFDLLQGDPVWVHPDSEYPFLHTHTVARLLLELAMKGTENEIFNVCGQGSVSFREIAKLASERAATIRYAAAQLQQYRISVAKLAQAFVVPDSFSEIRSFLALPPAIGIPENDPLSRVVR